MYRPGQSSRPPLPARVSAQTLALGVVLGLTSCRSALPAGVPAEAAPSASAVDVVPAGSALAVRRPTRGVALLSLWIDAGARDVSPPQVATVAAWWAATRAGAEARVLPDGTELRLLCNKQREAVAACAARLLQTLAVEAPSEAQLVALRERLRAARQLANGEARRAQALALIGLLGDAAAALSPLGAEGDDTKLTAATIGQFLARHYARSRSVLLGLGDVTNDELEAGRAPSQSAGQVSARASRALVLGAGQLQVELGQTNQIGLVVPSNNVQEAASLCERFRHIHPLASAGISSLRGGTLAHLDLPGGEQPFARLQAAVFDVQRLRLEQAALVPSPPPDTLDAMARQIGEQWVARGSVRAADRDVVGVGLVLARDEHAVESGDAALAKARERAVQAVEAGKKNSAGTTHGAGDDEHARVSSENGAQIEVVRRRGDGWFSAAIRFDGGSALDPPMGHGRAAVLATLMADGCAFSSERTLDLKLTTMQAKLTPLVDSAGVGVLISAPMQHAEQALDTLLRCAVRPTFSARNVEDARARLLKSLWGRESTLLHASLARALSPAAPGRVAPWGSPEGLAKVEVNELKRLHTQRAVGHGVSVWVVADRPPQELSGFVARRLSHLPSTLASEAESQLGPYGEIDGVLVASTQLRVVVGVRSAAGEPTSDAAQVFAEALRAALEKRVGQGLWSWGQSAPSLSVAGVALSVREDELDALQAHTQAALREIGSRPEASFQDALDGVWLTRSVQLASSRGWVEAAFHGRNEMKANSKLDIATIRKLAAEKPTYFVLRPHP